MEIFRPEHPNPQWERENWQNLNGEWDFEFDFGKSAYSKWKNSACYFDELTMTKKIIVPFCPESTLSGIGYTDFINGACYRRSFTLPKQAAGSRVLLHFGAVDFLAYIFVNQRYVGKHIGGYASFSLDITDYTSAGENTIFVIVEDEVRNPEQASGKQAKEYYSSGCDYTRVTGIWQTVWLEFVPQTYIRNAKFYPDTANQSLTICGQAEGQGVVCAAVSYQGRPMGTAQAAVNGSSFILHVPLAELHLWEPGHGRLYDLELSFGADKVKSYFGMRSIRLDGYRFLINEKSVFQRLVLDQGYYSDGIYTAKDEDALARDIRLSMDAGFNGARLHQKVFEPRFLYHCDKMGYLVWGEYGNWGIDYRNPISVENFILEWQEVISRDFNHPAIIGWCPANETWRYTEIHERHRCLATLYQVTKAMDFTRPCIDTSGNFHAATDIYDVHDYEQDVEKFRSYYERIHEGIIIDQTARMEEWKNGQKYNGEPVFVSEYGGIRWTDDPDAAGWGYGEAPQTPAEFIERYRGLTHALLDTPNLFGFCYTQLYDVEQEINGLYTYSRKPKFDPAILREINSKKAKIE